VSDPLDRDLERMAGSPELAKTVRANLVRLSKGAGGPDLAEMARDLLDGRTELSTIARSSAYADQISAATVQFQTWYAELTEEEREKLIADTEAHVADVEDDAQRRTPDGSRVKIDPPEAEERT
jgi:hypothetical protein